MSRSLSTRYAFLERYTGSAPLNKGGTGADNAQDAAVNLGAITLDVVGVNEGYVALDPDLKLPEGVLPDSVPTVVSHLSGNFTVPVNQSRLFTITDWDGALTYTITVERGNMTRLRDSIIYFAPATPGADAIVVNGRRYSLIITA